MIEIPTDADARKPTGNKPFVVDRCRFVYGSTIDTAQLDLAEDRLLSWPMVYILANDSTAYVGQTTSVATRINQHEANEERRDFTTVNIVYHDEFNSSVITDYEHRLIGLMHADGKYALTNKNNGMTDTNYFSKAEYAEMFEDLWKELQLLELADHSIAEIEESEVFKYSPYKGLTVDQKIALDSIMRAVENGFENAQPIVVEGMPGTGKTILAIFLLKMLRDDPRYKDFNIRIVEPVTALRKTLQHTLRNVSGLNPENIIGPSDVIKPSFGYRGNDAKAFDILLVDEAHKLKRRVNLGAAFGNHDRVSAKLGLPKESTQLDWILAQTKLPIFFYDPLQSIGPSCIEPANIKSALGASLEKPITLDSQMRVKGGKAYLDYVQAILSNRNPERQTFTDYEIVVHENPQSFVESFEQSLSEHSLTRLLAGYAWRWVTKNDPNPRAYDIDLGNVHLRWNRTNTNWVGEGFDDPAIAREVGCIHSIQGYDLSYAYVIVGEDLSVDKNTSNLVANREHYFDRNGYATATQNELDQFIKNIYYVLLTRGIYGTHIYVCDPTLRDYFKRFFPVVSAYLRSDRHQRVALPKKPRLRATSS